MAADQGKNLRLPSRFAPPAYRAASGRNEWVPPGAKRAVDRGHCTGTVRLSPRSLSAFDLFNRPLGVCIIWVELHRFPIGIERMLFISRVHVGFAQAIVSVPGVRVGPRIHLENHDPF